MLGLMQRRELLISSIIQHAARHHGDGEVVSRRDDGSIARTNYADSGAARAKADGCAARAGRRLRRPRRHAGHEQRPPSRTLLRRFRHGRGLPHHQSAPGAGRHRLHHQPRRRSCAVRRRLFRAAGRRHRAQGRRHFARDRGAGRSGRDEAARPAARHDAALLRKPDGGGARGGGLARLRRKHRLRPVLHLRHHGKAERRALFAPLLAAPCLRRQQRRRRGLARDDAGSAGRADVPCQRLGPALCRAHGRRRADHAGAPSRPGLAARPDGRRAGRSFGRRAHGLAGSGQSHATDRLPLQDAQEDHVGRGGAAARPGRRLRGIGRRSLSGLGHDRDQPHRHL